MDDVCIGSVISTPRATFLMKADEMVPDRKRKETGDHPGIDKPFCGTKHAKQETGEISLGKLVNRLYCTLCRVAIASGGVQREFSQRQDSEFHASRAGHHWGET